MAAGRQPFWAAGPEKLREEVEMTTTETVTLNNDQRLYVIPAGGGYSCLGFDVCEQRSKALANWISTNGGNYVPPKQPDGTLDAYNRYTQLCGIASELCRDFNIRCNVELTSQLIGLEGKRVEVVDKYGETRRFYVGKSMGWMPIHLEIATRAACGGHGVVGTPFKSVKVIGAC